MRVSDTCTLSTFGACVCIYICIYVYMYMYIYTHVYIHIYISISISTHTLFAATTERDGFVAEDNSFLLPFGALCAT